MSVACGQRQAQAPTSTPTVETTPSAIATAPSPSATPRPTAPGPLLFAVLEAKGTANAYTWNTVAVAGLDGRATAKTTFLPMPVPKMGCIGAVIPQSAHVAAGKVYFADGRGVVRSLSVTGQVAKVATFALTSSQQMLSFAVSPDGSRLLGTVFTIPAKANYACGGIPDTGYAQDVYSAPAGGRSTLLYHQSFQSTPTSVLALTGWDAVGPTGTYPTVWASQGGGPGSDLGIAVRIDANTGKVVRQVADPNVCRVWEVAATGDFVCMPDGGSKVSVRRPDGSEIWQFTVTTADGLVYGPQLAPDEAHVAVGINTATDVVGRTGSQSRIGFYPSGGWLDSGTLIGGMIDPLNSNPNLAYARLSAPGTVVSLGFPGLFVGTFHT